jgi:hypothetical protein
MKAVKLILLFLLFFNAIGKAQTGCLIAGRVYHPQIGTAVLTLPLGLLIPVYDVNQSYSTSVGSCPGWVTTGPPGQRCGNGTAPLGIVILGNSNGVEVTYSSIINCNLDDYSWPLATAAGLLGIFVIRRRNKL